MNRNSGRLLMEQIPSGIDIPPEELLAMKIVAEFFGEVADNEKIVWPHVVEYTLFTLSELIRSNSIPITIDVLNSFIELVDTFKVKLKKEVQQQESKT